MPPSKRFDPNCPSFDLNTVARLARERSGIISLGISDDLAKLDLFNEDIWEALEGLVAVDFHKTAIWKNHPDQMVDVYYITVGDHSIYLKFSVVSRDDAPETLVISSFHENEHI